MIPLLLLVACGPNEVLLHGNVAVDRAEDAPPLVGGTVAIHDAAGAPWASTTTGADGSFSVTAPRGESIHAIVSGDDLVPASFAGQSGVVDEFTVPDGVLWGFSADELATWEQDFAGCPGIGDPGGAVILELSYFLVSEEEDGEPPDVRRARVWAEALDGSERHACYLDAEGAYDPTAIEAGPAQVAAIFGLAPGPWWIVVRHGVTDTSYAEEDALVVVPEGGVVPRFPFWIDLVIPS